MGIKPKSLISHLRAGLEGIFTKYFGSKIRDEIFERNLKEKKKWRDIH